MSEQKCFHCERPAIGTLRVALWDEEARGRLAARSVDLCGVCHQAFLKGQLSRVVLAREYHKAKGYEPAEGIGRIDRDTLLDIACLQCGVLLPVEKADTEIVKCSHCGSGNRFGERETDNGVSRLTVSIEA